MSYASRVRWAIAVDLLAGEPPEAIHPTVWMGRALGAARRWHGGRPRTPGESLVAGMATLGVGALAAGMLGARAERLSRRAPAAARDVIGGLLLEPALSLRALVDAGRTVEDALRRDDLAAARRLLAWHLVSRDTSRLRPSEVAGATVESLAENLSDGVVAPLLHHALGGLGGAYFYRFVNTADAMVGYRTPELEWFGMAAARADDALNIVPARLTALLIALAAPIAGGSTRDALRVARADAGRTASPNAAWPMAAMAGALGVRLDKREPVWEPVAPGDGAAAAARTGPRRAPRTIYVLNEDGRAPTVADIARARTLVLTAALLGTAMTQLPLDGTSRRGPRTPRSSTTVGRGRR